MVPKMQILWTLTALFSILNAHLQKTDDTHVVECNTTMPCAGDLVTDCLEVDKPCIIDCTQGDEICKDAAFQCHPHHDCTLLCDSTNANKACLGTMLNASQSSDIHVNVMCLNSRACEYMTILANATDIQLNITIRDAVHAPYEQYIAKHADIYLPQSGIAYLTCEGHSACHSVNIYGNLSTDSTTLHFMARGPHAFKDSFISFPSDSDVDIVCDSTSVDGNGGDNIGECCSGTVFDGRFGGIDSDIHIQCIGNNACYDTVMFANHLTKSLMITGNNGDYVLSKADIYCPSSKENKAVDAMSNCNINVYGNASGMLIDAKIHSLNGFEDVLIECDYATSIEQNCYTNDQSGPTLYCDESCRLVLSDSKNEWKCVNDDVICYDKEDDDNTDEGTDASAGDSDEISTTLGAMFDDNSNTIRENHVGLRHNVKGQIVLTTIILILVALLVAVWLAKKEYIKDWVANPFDTLPPNGRLDHSVMRIPNYNGNLSGIGATRKNRYTSLEDSCSPNEDEDSEFIVSDPTDEEEFDD